MAFRLAIAIDDPTIDTDKGGIDHRGPLGAARALRERGRWQGLTAIVGEHSPSTNVGRIREIAEYLFTPVSGEDRIVRWRQQAEITVAMLADKSLAYQEGFADLRTQIARPCSQIGRASCRERVYVLV